MKRTWIAVSALAVTLILVGCAPDLDKDPVPAYMEFDPASDPPRIPLPNVVLLNQSTGLLDFGLPNEPSACNVIEGISKSECYFYQYLQTMDGFPTNATVTVPSSAELDMSTVTLTGGEAANLAVFALLKEQGLDVIYDTENRQLVIAHPDGWDVDSIYVVAVRGYDNGVTTVDGDRVVAPTAYSLLKREESLINCNPDPPDPNDLIDPVVDRDCKFFHLLAEGLDLEDPADASAIAEVEETLISLEMLRQGFLAEGLWAAVELIASMTKDEIAMVFAFPIHTGPVVELDPTAGKVPEVVSSTEIQLPVKGTLDASTLTPFSLINPAGTVLLLNATKLDQGDFVGGFPAFTPTYENDAIVFRTTAPMVAGDSYVIALATVTPYTNPRPAITNDDGVAMVPPPAVVLLRSRWPVYDDQTGESLVSSVDAATAQMAEDGRQQLAALLDNAAFPLAREEVGYVYGFEFQVP